MCQVFAARGPLDHWADLSQQEVQRAHEQSLNVQANWGSVYVASLVVWGISILMLLGRSPLVGFPFWIAAAGWAVARKKRQVRPPWNINYRPPPPFARPDPHVDSSPPRTTESRSAANADRPNPSTPRDSSASNETVFPPPTPVEPLAKRRRPTRRVKVIAAGIALLTAAGLVVAMAAWPDRSATATSSGRAASSSILPIDPPSTTPRSAPAAIAPVAPSSASTPPVTAEVCSTHRVTLSKLPIGLCDRGHVVELIQELLDDSNTALDIPGDFGAATRDAVSAFQSQESLGVTGVVDLATWTKLTAGHQIPGFDLDGDGLILPDELGATTSTTAPPNDSVPRDTCHLAPDHGAGHRRNMPHASRQCDSPAGHV